MPDDWREAARERYCGIQLDRLEAAYTLEEREAIAGRIEWLLGVNGAEAPDERTAMALTFRKIEWQPATCAWPGCEVILTSLGEARAHMAEHESMGRRIPVSQEAWAPPVFDGAGEDGHA